MTFHVGQRVVCIKEGRWSNNDDYPGESFPLKGRVYTIRTISCDDDGTWLRFREIVNRPREYEEGFGEAEFCATRFRPVVERKTDISIFQKLLIPQRDREPV